MSKHPIIVIGRQFGSGGHEIGVKLAEKLGIPLYDKEILAKIAEEQGITVEHLQKMDESLKGNHMLNVGIQAQGFNVFNMGYLFETDTSAVVSRNQVFEWQTKKVKELAAEGPCVIIGRCADYILRDEPGMVSVFITAPIAAREDRIAKIHPNHPRDFYETHLQFIQKTDKARANYYSYHTGRDWGSMGNYHLCVDATRLGIDGTVDLLAEYVKQAVK